MAEAAARIWANQGAHLLLAGRAAARLDAIAADLRTRGAVVDTVVVDLAVVEAKQALAEMIRRLGSVDVVLVAYGLLSDQKLAESDPAEAQRLLATNFTSAAGWCLAAATMLENQGHGTLVVIGSVAGDRGRASNYVYGAAKGGLGILVQGLAHRLARTGARAVLIKPGFVDTPMTAHIARKGFLWAQPETIGNAIVKATRAGSRCGPIVYAPGFWRWIMVLICMTPSAIFHKTKL
jgi:NAD(P)-dependent dehydrogenase (short-subunit alcohol dehydrogenase family)